MNDSLSDSRYDSDMPALGGRSLLFLHIPKAGGTSFIDLLGSRFAPLDILAVRRKRSGSVTQSLAEAERYPFVYGHFPYDVVNLFARRPFLFTVLRDPVDRALSAFWFMKQQSSHMERLAAAGQIPGELGRDFAKAGALTLSEFVRKEPRAAGRHLGNLQVDFLTCADLDKRFRFEEHYEVDVSTQALDLAKERLATFDAFGLFERLPETKEYLAYALQTRPFGDLNWCNKTRSRPVVEDIDAETAAELRRLTCHDRELYAFAKELSEIRRRAMSKALPAGHANATTEPGRRCRSSSFTSSMALPGGGWCAAENDGNRWFNWTGPGSESWIELGTPEGSEFELRIGVLHALKPETLFELELFVNDARLKPEVSRDSAGHTICAPVAAHLLRPAGMSNTITLRVPHLSRPCDCDPMNDDSRMLGIAVYQIGLVAVPGRVL
jgi:hypothetical protein